MKSCKSKFTKSPMAAAQVGFTLIEILIVITLIALIATYFGRSLLQSADRGKYSIAKTALEKVAADIDEYQNNVGSMPPNLDALVKAPGNSSGWLGPYAKEQELKDPWGHALEYHVPGESGAPYDLISLGKDGKPGGEGVDADIRHQ
jgi:general secretion pathway protein G